MNDVHMILEGPIDGDTNHSRKVHAMGTTHQEEFNIIQRQGKGKEHMMIGEDLVFIQKEVGWPMHTYYDALVVNLQVANNKIIWYWWTLEV